MKHTTKFVAVMVTAAVLLAGCGGTAVSEKQEVETGSVDTGDVTVEGADLGEADTGVITTGDVDTGDISANTEGPDQETLTKMLDGIKDWAGLVYFYEDGQSHDITTLTVQEALPMAGHAMVADPKAQEEMSYDEMEGAYTANQKLVDQWTENYFGQTYPVSDLVSDEEHPTTMISASEDGRLLIRLGDWGLSAPVYAIREISQNEQGQWLVSVDYSRMDYEENKQSEPEYHIDYILEENAASEFGYVIADMTGKFVK